MPSAPYEQGQPRLPPHIPHIPRTIPHTITRACSGRIQTIEPFVADESRMVELANASVTPISIATAPPSNAREPIHSESRTTRSAVLKNATPKKSRTMIAGLKFKPLG